MRAAGHDVINGYRNGYAAQNSNPLGFLNNPQLTGPLLSAGGAALGSAVAGPLGGAIGAGAAPVITGLTQNVPVERTLPQAGLAALGGSLGGYAFGPLGAAAGGGLGSYFGGRISPGRY